MHRSVVVAFALTLAGCGDSSAPETPTAPQSVSVTVTVLDADEKPVVGASVSASFRHVGAHADTDAAGKAILAGLDPSRTYGFEVAPLPPNDYEGDIGIADWRPADVTFHLRQHTIVRGRVLDEHGQPQHDVLVVTDLGRRLVTDGVAAPDAHGVFDVFGWRAKPTVELKVFGAFTTPLGTRTVKPDGKPVDVSIRLGATLIVRVPHAEDAMLLSAKERSRVQSSRGGVVRFVGLSDSERYTIWIPPEHEEFGLVEGVRADGAEHAASLTRGLAIEGRVLWPAGISPKPIDVVAERGLLIASPSTASEERFHFPGLPPGAWTLKATVRDDPTLTGTVETTAGSGVNLTLHRP